MKKLIFAISIITMAVFVLACSHKLYTPTEPDVTYAQSRWKNTDMARLQRGKNYYEAHCGKCHGLKNPVKYSEEKWHEIMPEMARKSKIKDSTSSIILEYVLTAAQGIKNQREKKKPKQ